MTYNLTSALFIAVFLLLFREYHGRIVLLAVLLGFAGMLLIYKPAMHLPWFYHVAGLISGVTSALAYITVNYRLAGYYDSRIIVLAFIGTGVLVPTVFMIIRYLFNIPVDDVFYKLALAVGIEWFYVVWLGLAALFGQYFVAKAYGADKAGVVSAIGYANIIFSVFIGMALGDAFPDWMSSLGILCIIASGVIISLVKRKTKPA